MNFNDVVEKLEKGRDKIYAKGKAAKEVFMLKGEISTCENIIDKAYIEIGKRYVEKFSENPDPSFEKNVRDIQNAKIAIKALQEKIDQINL